MATIIRAEATISAQNKLRPGINAAMADLKRFHAQAGQLSRISAIENRMAGFSRALQAGAGALAAYGVADRMRQSIKDFALLDREMRRIGITGDAGEGEVSKGLIRMRELAQEVAMPIADLKGGMDALTAAGLSFQDSLAMLPSVARTAQASGSKTEDIANSSLALVRHLKIEAKDLQKAQDMLAKGGAIGQFELKDMARYLPSIAPAAKAVGVEGTKGLAKLVAMLQIVREGAGTSEEAATNFENILSKMESEETANKFKKMGVDLRRGMEGARKNGEDLFDTFVKLTNQALKGDMSKLPQLFQDMQVQKGMRALLDGYNKLGGMIGEINNSQGQVAQNLKRLTGDTQASIDRFSEAANRATSAVGGFLAAGADSSGLTSDLDKMAAAFERMAKTAKEAGLWQAIKQGASEFNDRLQEDYRNETDDIVLKNMVKRASRDNRAEITGIQNTLDMLERMPNVPDRANKIANLKKRLEAAKAGATVNEDEAQSLSRQQFKMQPHAAGGLSQEDIDQIREDSREARRASAFARIGKDAQPSGKPMNAPTPPIRPDLGAINIPVQGLDVAEKKAEAFKALIELIGPTAQGSSATMNSSFTSAISQMIADVDRLQIKLNSLRMPAFTGLGGLPVGKNMTEAQ